jgi:predicted ATPase/class 3 adenylate cyclase
MSKATVALLFSDIEGSTRLLQRLGPDYGRVLLLHREALRAVFAAHDGTERGTEGDSFFVTFPTASDAAAAALAGQHAIRAVEWPAGAHVRVRMGLHLGSVELIAEGVVGLAVHEAARIAASAHGGQIVASAALAHLSDGLPPASHWLDLGEHRLKDLPDPVALVQLCDAGLPEEFPPLRAEVNERNNLPAQSTALVGRRDELAAVGSLLDGSSLVTITGTGGVGKSRIALAVAAARVERYRDGVWFVELARASSAESVEPEVLAALGLSSTAPAADQLADKDALLVLDNCEHLLDAVAALVEQVAARCPKVRLLLTSREPIGVPGEVVWRVPPMQLNEAVELLEERARAVSASFTVSDSSRAAVVELCTRLDAIPLALELAAARLGGLGIENLIAHLDQRFRLLGGGTHGRVERHRTLQATMDWSYALLEPREQMVLQRLGVFVGGFVIEAAAAVCDDLDALDVLDAVDRLVTKSLIVAEPGSSEMRYLMLETVRQYATDRAIDTGQLEGARDAHLDWVTSFARDLEKAVWLDGDERAWLERLDSEDANVRAACEWALGTQRADVAAWLLFAQFPWLTSRGRSRECLELSRRLSQEALDGPDRAMVDFLALAAESNVGPIDPRSVAACAVSAPLLSETRQPWLQLVAESYTTAWSYPRGDRPAAAVAATQCERTAEAARHYGSAIWQWCLQPVIWTNLDAGRLDAAQSAADQALAAATGMSFRESRAALNSARIAMAADKVDDAWTFGEQATVAARRTGEFFVANAAVQLMADVAERRGDRALARDLLLSIVDVVMERQSTDDARDLTQRIASLSD